MKIIIEGCDCVGKTTLIEKLKLKYSQSIVKHFFNPPKNLTKEEQHNWCKTEYFNELNYSKFPITMIYDRYYFGEQIYAPKYRNYYPNYINELEEELNKENAYLILLVANISDLHKRFDGKFININDMEEIQKKYNSLFQNSKIKNKYKYSTSTYKPEELTEIIYNDIK